MPLSKILLIGGSVGLASATAGGIAFYLRPTETIVSYISKQNSSKNKKFISFISDAEADLEKKYSTSRDSNNKPSKGGKIVEKIVEWCKESKDIKFSSESDPNYSLISSWCFVNTNNLLEEMKAKGKSYVSDKEEGHEEWKTAWDVYNNGKTSSNFPITAEDIEDLNKKDKNKGGPALYKWCKAQDNKKMYSSGSEEIYKRYEKWCFKV